MLSNLVLHLKRGKMTDNKGQSKCQDIDGDVTCKPPQFYFKIIAFYSNLKIKDVHVIVVVLSSHLVSSPTVGS